VSLSDDRKASYFIFFVFARELLPRAFAIDTNPDLDYPEVDWAENPNKQVGGANCSLTSQPQPFYFLKKSKKLAGTFIQRSHQELTLKTNKNMPEEKKEEKKEEEKKEEEKK